MIVVNVVYYQNELSHKLEVDRAIRKGEITPRRRKTVLGIKLPYLPRPGDRLYIEDRVDTDNEVVNLNGVEVKFVEMIDGNESVYVHTTDPGCEPFGRVPDKEKKEIEDFVGHSVKFVGHSVKL